MKVKLLGSLLLTASILTGCGEPKVGDTFEIKDDVPGGYEAGDYDKLLEQVSSYNDINFSELSPDQLAVINSRLGVSERSGTASEGSNVTIKDYNEQYDEFLIEYFDNGKETKLWVGKDDLLQAK